MIVCPLIPRLPARATLRRQARPSDEPSGGLKDDFRAAVEEQISPEDLHYYRYKTKPRLTLERAQQLAAKRALMATLKKWYRDKRHLHYEAHKEDVVDFARELSEELVGKDVFWKPIRPNLQV